VRLFRVPLPVAHGTESNTLLLLQHQRCLTTASVDSKADVVTNEESRDRQCSITVGKLDTVKSVVDEKRVQRSDGHFDLLGMQIFLYKGRMSAERSSRFFKNCLCVCFNTKPLRVHFLLHWVVAINL